MEDFFIWLTVLLTGGGVLMTVAMPVCICGAFLVVAASIGVWVYQGYFRPAQEAKRAAQAWPSAPGVVLSSFVNTESSYDSTSNSETTSYHPHVTYEYDVNGQRYRSERLKASDGFYRAGMLPGNAQAVVDRYPPGAQITVYYNPANPQES